MRPRLAGGGAGTAPLVAAAAIRAPVIALADRSRSACSLTREWSRRAGDGRRRAARSQTLDGATGVVRCSDTAGGSWHMAAGAAERRLPACRRRRSGDLHDI